MDLGRRVVTPAPRHRLNRVLKRPSVSQRGHNLRRDDLARPSRIESGVPQFMPEDGMQEDVVLELTRKGHDDDPSIADRRENVVDNLIMHSFRDDVDDGRKDGFVKLLFEKQMLCNLQNRFGERP
jgi:hypothetical protein